MNNDIRLQMIENLDKEIEYYQERLKEHVLAANHCSHTIDTARKFKSALEGEELNLDGNKSNQPELQGLQTPQPSTEKLRVSEGES